MHTVKKPVRELPSPVFLRLYTNVRRNAMLRMMIKLRCAKISAQKGGVNNVIQPPMICMQNA